MSALSVIICTHNPRNDYFARCLVALEAQSLAREKWELVLVDNASVPDKAPCPDLSWHPTAHLIHEGKLGLAPARLRGIREATSEVFVFVDDDNVLEADYLTMALRVAEDLPFLGPWSGQCHPELERPPPEWTRSYWGNLSMREFDKDIWSNLPRLPESMPWGAGLCVRRDVAMRYLVLHATRKRSFQFDRSGESLLSGGDNDLAARACDLGLGVGLIASLRLTHLIPPERFTEAYLARLAERIQFSSTLLDGEHGIPPVRREILGRIADFLRLMRLKPPLRRVMKSAHRGRERATRLLVSGDKTRGDFL